MIFGYLALYAAAAAHLWHYYPLLPEKMATHFGADGQPNGWMGRDEFALFYAGLFVLLTGIFFAMGAIVKRLPARMINIPNKSYWMAPERAEQTRSSYANDLSVMGIFIGAFVIGIHHMLITMALGGVNKLDTTEFFVWLGVFLAGIAFFIIRQLLRFRKPDELK